jgi:hypothetical protein
LTRYKLLALAAGLALAASITGAGPASASSGLGTRTLENAMRGLCLSSGNSPGNQVVVSTTCTSSLGATWTFSGAAGGSNTLKNGYGLCLDARDDSTHNPSQLGDPVQVWSCNGGSQQEWDVEVAYDSNNVQYIKLFNEASAGGYVLDARNDGNHSAGTSGDPVQLYQYNGTSNQHWGVLTPS